MASDVSQSMGEFFGNATVCKERWWRFPTVFKTVQNSVHAICYNASLSYALKRRIQGKKQTLLVQFMALVALSSHWVGLFIDKSKLSYFCPVALTFGEAATGNTTALQCSTALLGALDSKFYSMISNPTLYS